MDYPVARGYGNVTFEAGKNGLVMGAGGDAPMRKAVVARQYAGEIP